MSNDEDEYTGGIFGRDLANGVAAVFAQLRETKGWTHAELADIAGLDRTYIGKVESGKRFLTIAAAAGIANALGVSLSSAIQSAELRLVGDDLDAASGPRLVEREHLHNSDFLVEKLGLSSEWIGLAINETYAQLDLIDNQLRRSSGLRLADLVEFANLSSMIGNLLRSSLVSASGGTFSGNAPHTFPDLLSNVSSVPGVEIKMAMESNKPKGHLPKPGFHLTVRYVLADSNGNYLRGKENRSNVAWIWEVRAGELASDDFSVSNTAGDSGKTAVIKTPSLDRLVPIYFNPKHNPHVRSRPSDPQ